MCARQLVIKNIRQPSITSQPKSEKLRLNLAHHGGSMHCWSLLWLAEILYRRPIRFFKLITAQLMTWQQNIRWWSFQTTYVKLHNNWLIFKTVYRKKNEDKYISLNCNNIVKAVYLKTVSVINPNIWTLMWIKYENLLIYPHGLQYSSCLRVAKKCVHKLANE